MQRLLMILLVCVSTTALAQKRVAVLPLTNKAKLTDTEKLYLTDLIRGLAVDGLRDANMIVMDRANMEVLLGPDRTLGECVGSCAVDTAKNLKAHYVVTGELVTVFGGYRLSLRAHASKTGQMLKQLVIKIETKREFETRLEAEAPPLFQMVRRHSIGLPIERAIARRKSVPVKKAPPRETEAEMERRIRREIAARADAAATKRAEEKRTKQDLKEMVLRHEAERWAEGIGGPLSAEQRSLSAEALNDLGVKAYQARSFENAVAFYRVAVTKDPSFAQAYGNMGLALSRLGRFAESIAASEKAIFKASGKRQNLIRAGAYYNIGQVHEKQLSFAKAFEAYRSANNARPRKVYLEALRRMRAKL